MDHLLHAVIGSFFFAFSLCVQERVCWLMSSSSEMLTILTDQSKTICLNKPTVLSIILESMEEVHQPQFRKNFFLISKISK